MLTSPAHARDGDRAGEELEKSASVLHRRLPAGGRDLAALGLSRGGDRNRCTQEWDSGVVRGVATLASAFSSQCATLISRYNVVAVGRRSRAYSSFYHGRPDNEGKKITWRDGLRGVCFTLRYGLAG